MNKVKILPDNLANQIAAGEVVERPASVVKELVENALDAGGRRIQIETELGGRRLMRVSDDGEGMVRDDAILAFERHATSKIKTLEDLSRIETLGFRGEALASIASVSKVELITKTADTDAATRVYIEGGKLIDVKEIGRSQGTTVSVRDLFFNTPARRKFMRSEATENYHIASIVTHYALANPHIAFTLTGNGREVLRLSPAKDLRERAYQIFGAQMIESLLPVSGGREYVAKISGFISAPRERRTTRDAQFFFINGRFVRDKIIAGGLLEGFRAVLPHGVYPVAFLFLEIPLEEIDVNVHPAKTEVRFRRSEAVKEVISEAIRGALRNAGIVPNQESRIESRDFGNENRSETLLAESSEKQSDRNDIDAKNYEQTKIEFPLESQFIETEIRPLNAVQKPFENVESVNQTTGETVETQNFELPISSTDFEESEQRKENHELATTNNGLNDGESIGNWQSATDTQNSLPPLDSGAKIPKSIEVENLSGGKIRPIGQLRESFIIATDDEGMLLIDQHVAHERILFDKFRQGESERNVESQNLLLPETIDLTPAQSVAFDLVEAELENCGFGLMRLSGRTVAIKSVPTDLPASEVRNLFAEILDTIVSDKRGNARETLRDRIAATLACKAAVKINMKLTPEKMQWMIDKLLTTSSPTTCPHGRPVILRLTLKDIERGFHRT
jgi:DNA mismatch repair protein MutL